MGIDQKGTAPGLVRKTSETPKVHNVKCRVDGCDSNQAYDLSPPHQDGATHNRIYQCVKCHHSWPLAVGGSFPYF